jgi:hypothetical protein
LPDSLVRLAALTSASDELRLLVAQGGAFGSQVLFDHADFGGEVGGLNRNAFRVVFRSVQRGGGGGDGGLFQLIYPFAEKGCRGGSTKSS